jgi:hypothetical protein
MSSLPVIIPEASAAPPYPRVEPIRPVPYIRCDIRPDIGYDIRVTYIRCDIGYDIIYDMNVWGVTLYRNIKMLACMAS